MRKQILTSTFGQYLSSSSWKPFRDLLEALDKVPVCFFFLTIVFDEFLISGVQDDGRNVVTKLQVPDWASWTSVPNWLPEKFHSSQGSASFMKWAKGCPHMVGGESELHCHLGLYTIALSYGLAFQDIIRAAEVEPGEPVPGSPSYLPSSPYTMQHADTLGAVCIGMASSILEIHGSDKRSSRRQAKMANLG